MYDDKFGGRRSDIDGYCRFINGSEIFFIGLDNFDEKSLKSFAINTAIVDQAEELDENIYIHLDSRIGRWNEARVPAHLQDLPFPVNEFTGEKMPPGYHILAVNPDSRLHWVFRRYHPDSPEKLDSHILINCPSTANPALSKETLQAMLSRDPEWVKRYVYGEWGISDATIHTVFPDSIIEPSEEWLKNFLFKAKLYRILDHGESSPTVCLWFAQFEDYHICYREYYCPNELISKHRQNISDLSGQEKYSGSFADPSIFDKTSQKKGGRWSVADEYMDKTLNAPSIYWQPADNNEFPIRNRINELLKLDSGVTHPITGREFAPSLYFIKRNSEFPNGCENVIKQTSAQRRELLGTENGRNIYSDDREKSITDHAYDCLRYYCSIKGLHKPKNIQVIPHNSFFDVRNEIKKLKYANKWNNGIPSFAA